MKAKLLTVILLFGTGLAIAQQTETTIVSPPASGVWSLKQCIDYALANNLSVQRSEYNVVTNKVNLTQSKMAFLPNLNVSASYGYNWGRSVDPTTNDFTTSEIRSTSPFINSQWTVFNGLTNYSTYKQSTTSYSASEEDLQKAKNDVSVNIATLYITVIFNKEQLENAKFQLSSTQQQYERTKKQVAAGALPKSNELNLDAQVATNELNVINRENALALSLLQLKQALQLPAATQIDVEVPAIDVEDLVMNQTRDEIYQVAVGIMPEIKSAQLKVESSYYAAKASKGSLYPSLTLGGSVRSNYSSAADIGDGYGWWDQLSDNIFRSANLTVSIPIFNNYRSRAAYQRSVINSKLAEISEKETQNTLRQNVETAYNDALAASKTYTSSLRQVQAREEAFRMTQQRFDNGAANYVEYQVAENDLFQAKSDLVRAKYDFIFRKKLLDFYQGKPLAY